MTNRLARLEGGVRATHRAAWDNFFRRFRGALTVVPDRVFEGPFQPLELDDFSDLEDALLPWESWADAALPLLEKAENDLGVWPTDLPPTPGDAKWLLLELVSRWRKNPRLPVAALVTLLALAVAAEGEGGVAHQED